MNPTLTFLTALLLAPLTALHANEWTDVFVAGEGYRHFRIPALLRTPGGDLLALADGRPSDGDFAGQDLVARRSTDGGRTWGKLQVIHEEGRHHIGGACPLVQPDTGRIFLFFIREPAAVTMDGLKQGIIPASYDDPLSSRVFVIQSDDDGRTWSPRREITRQVRPPGAERALCVPGAGISLTRGPHRGRLVVPFHEQRGWKQFLGSDGAEHQEKIAFRAYVAFSDDGGRSWKMGQPGPEVAGVPPTAAEPQIAELADGSLLMNCRNQHIGHSLRKVARSVDGGATWTPLTEEPALVEPRCQAFLLRFDWPAPGRSGRLFFSNPAQPRGRSKGTLKISEDDGRTWSRSILLHPGLFAHSVLVQTGHETVGILAELDGYRRIAFTSLTLPKKQAE
ncbi:MAG: exo-alpha-sialidase [Verrucomicrobia bacterium]|nr:exo-alpha-sialidase [Verrucomicrobiota bacterium]